MFIVNAMEEIMFKHKFVIVSILTILAPMTWTNGEENRPSTTTPAVKGTPKIRCEQPVYEFSGFYAGGKVTHTFVIHNYGADAA